MSLFVKDPTSVKKLAITLKAEQKRHSELPIIDQFLIAAVKAALLFNSGDLPTKASAASSSEGIKINNGSILETAYEKLRKHNVRYLEVVNGKIDFGTYPASVRLNFGMTTGSAKIPDMITHADIMGVSELIDTGNAELIALGLTPPLDFTAAENAAYLLDCNNKLTIYVTSEDVWKANESALAESLSICRPLATTVRKAVQFNVSDLSEPAMRTYCETFGIVFEIKKETTEVDVLALFADGSGIAVGINIRIGKLFTDKNKVKKIESVQGVNADTNAHGEAILNTTQTGDELFLIWEGTGIVKGSLPLNIIAGEDQSMTIHVVKSPPEV